MTTDEKKEWLINNTKKRIVLDGKSYGLIPFNTRTEEIVHEFSVNVPQQECYYTMGNYYIYVVAKPIESSTVKICSIYYPEYEHESKNIGFIYTSEKLNLYKEVYMTDLVTLA